MHIMFHGVFFFKIGGGGSIPINAPFKLLFSWLEHIWKRVYIFITCTCNTHLTKLYFSFINKEKTLLDIFLNTFFFKYCIYR